MRNPQLNKHGELTHLISTEGLSRDILQHILDTAQTFVPLAERDVKKVPLLRGKSVFNLSLKTQPAHAPLLRSRQPVCQPMYLI